MIDIITNSKNLVNNIMKFAVYEDKISFAKSNKCVESNFNPTDNEEANIQFFSCYEKKFISEEDEDYFNIENENIEFESGMNWGQKMQELESHETKMKILDEKANKSIDFIFRYHIYLPDLRKPDYYLEFNNSSIFTTRLYDINKSNSYESRYYDKRFTEGYMLDLEGNKNIIPLRERQYYEKELLNLKESLKEIKGNKLYIKILNEEILEYNYQKLEEEFKNFTIDELRKINPILCFVWLITKYFELYLAYVKESILKYKENPKNKKFFIEFIKQHNNVMNVILFINSNFNNVNIIIKYWNKYLNKGNEKSGKTFSLMDLFLIMYKENVYDKIISLVIVKLDEYFEKLGKNGRVFFVEEKNNKMDIDNDNDNDNEDIIYEEDNNSFEDTKDNCSSDEEKEEDYSLKNIIEDLGNCILDIELNKDKAHGINHTGIKLGDTYHKYENVLIKAVERYLEENLDEGKVQQKFEELKSLLEADKSPRRLLNNNIKLINKTKRAILENVVNKLVKYVAQKFNLENKCYNYETKNEDFSEFSEESEKNIRKNIDNEIKEMKGFLIKNNSKMENVENVVENYIEHNGDEIVILAKEIIYFYYKEKQFYQDNDTRVWKILKGNNIDTSILDEKK